MTNIRKRPLCSACLAVIFLLYLSVRLRPVPEQDYGAFQGKSVTFTGKVYARETSLREQEEIQVLYLKQEKENADHSTAPPGERVICYLKAGEEEPELGSVVKVKGKLSAFEKASNPGQFDACSYYQILKISYRINHAEISAKTTSDRILSQKLYQLKKFFSGKLSEALPAKEASVMRTMLLGEKSGMDQELKALYQRNGIAHILAISGLHISMLGMGLYRLLRKCAVPMKTAAALAMGFMLLYGVMTGFSVSSIRAVVMFSLRMLSVLAERTYDMLTAAALAAAGILIEQPLYFYHSGFCFSFGCVLGIGLLLPALTEEKPGENEFVRKGKIHTRPSGREKLLPLAKGLLGSAGMAVVTFPVYLWFYFQFPLYCVFLNLLVIPLMSFLVGAGLLLLAVQLLCPFLGEPFVLLIEGVLFLYEQACRFCDGLPGNILTFGQPSKWQMAVYLLLLLLIFLFRKKLGLALRWGLALLAVLFLIYRPADGLKITFLDVGQGDCIYIENDNGDCYLVDGGSSSVSRVGNYRILPFLKSRGASSLEAVFVTHPDEDHCSGIRELLETGKEQGIRVKNLVLPDVAKKARSEGYLTLAESARKAGIPVTYLSKGQVLKNNRLTLTCLHPEKKEGALEPNEYSVVLEVSYGNFSALLTGDVEGEGERQLLEELGKRPVRGRVTVLKVAHHGSKNSTPVSFLERERPLYAVISCGERNSYGHPHEELLKRLENCGAEILITWESGAVCFCTDGKRVRVEEFLISSGGTLTAP